MLARLRLPSRVAARSFFKASTPLLGGEDLKREPSIYDIKKAFADKCFTIFDVDGNGGTVKASELPVHTPMYTRYTCINIIYTPYGHKIVVRVHIDPRPTAVCFQWSFAAHNACFPVYDPSTTHRTTHHTLPYSYIPQLSISRRSRKALTTAKSTPILWGWLWRTSVSLSLAW